MTPFRLRPGRALEGGVDELLGGVEPHPPESPAERVGDRDRVGHRVVVEVDQDDDVDPLAEALGEVAGRRHGVAAVDGDQRVRDGSHPAASPPARLGVGRDPDRAGDMGGPAVAGLDQPVVVARGKEENRFAGGGLDHTADVGHHQRTPRERPQVKGLEMGEEAVVALDRQHRLPGLDPVALRERRHPQIRPAVAPAAVRRPPARAEIEDRQRLVDPAEQAAVLGKGLHRHPRVTTLGFEQLLGEDEVGVRVVAGADFPDREPEDLRR